MSTTLTNLFRARPSLPETSGDRSVRLQTLTDVTAYGALLIFTILLYVRPNDLFPNAPIKLPLAKIAVSISLLAFFLCKFLRKERHLVWSLELSLTTLIGVIALLHLPFISYQQESLSYLLSNFFKIVCVMALLVNVVSTRARLRLMIYPMILSGTVMALESVRQYLAGLFVAKGLRIRGYVGVFSDTNDLALCLALLVPQAIAFALLRPGRARWLWNFCAIILGLGIIATYSRGGWLGLLAGVILLLWKLRTTLRHFAQVLFLLLAFLLIAIPLFTYGPRIVARFTAAPTVSSPIAGSTPPPQATSSPQTAAPATPRPQTPITTPTPGNTPAPKAVPKNAAPPPLPHGGIAHRLTTIIRPDREGTGESAQQRWLLLKITGRVIAEHFPFGVGMRNFIHHSGINKVAHNAWLEILAELGLAGFLAYVLLIVVAFRRLLRVEAEANTNTSDDAATEAWFLSIGLQCALAVYAVCSSLLSVEYYWHIYYLVAFAIILDKLPAHAKAPAQCAPVTDFALASPQPVTHGERHG